MYSCQSLNPLSRLREVIASLLFATLVACGGDTGRAVSLGAQAQQQLEAGKIAAARASIISAIAERDDIVDLHTLRGRIEVTASRFGPAYEAFAAAMALDPTNGEALGGVAQLGLRTGHLSEAEDATEKILTLNPDQPDALLIEGLLALLRNREGKALEAADHILAIAPNNEGATILKARALYSKGDERGALKFLNEALPKVGQTESIARTRLELLRANKDAAGMMLQFTALRTLAPHDIDLRIDEANLRYKLGDTSGARGVTRSVLFELKPDAVKAAQITGLWREYDFFPLSDTQRAQLAGASEDAKIEVARYYLDTGRGKMAERLLSDSDTATALALKARAAIGMGEVGRGSALADKVLAGDVTHCDALIARASAAILAAHLDMAVIAAQTAATECPQNVAAHQTLAQAYVAKDDTAGTRRAFVDGIARNPQNSTLSRAFVGWLGREGQHEPAIAEARRLTRKAPALVSAWDNYLDVCKRYGDEICAVEARSGRERSFAILGVDPPPGTLSSRGLMGRLSMQ